MAEPTSTLTFSDLILKVAVKLGVAYYGSSGADAAQIPIDAHDLALVKGVVNDGIRMFIHDAPAPNGWRWLRPVASVVLWGSVSPDATNPILTAVHNSGITTLTVGESSFYPSMELHDITITDVGTFNISEYVSATSVKVTGNASAAHGANKTWRMTADGNYTLPLTFGGQYLGQIVYAAQTNRGIGIEWCDESLIRQWRADVTDESGDPYLAAVRVMDRGSPRRRWELAVYPQPSETLTVQFPYMLHFDKLVNLTEVSPAPFGHDETVLAACLAVAERDVEDSVQGPAWQYYQRCLANSYRVDAMSAPRKLTSTTRYPSIQTFRSELYQRPTVTFNP